MAKVYYILKYSCVLTLARKNRKVIGTIKKVYKTYGQDLEIITNNKKVAHFPEQRIKRNQERLAKQKLGQTFNPLEFISSKYIGFKRSITT